MGAIDLDPVDPVAAEEEGVAEGEYGLLVATPLPVLGDELLEPPTAVAAGWACCKAARVARSKPGMP